MKQALHIFRKDLRHQWLDITLYATILILFASISPLVEDGRWVNNTALPWLARLLQVLMPLCWVVITMRLVLEESPVGDRQFWTTRPYHWVSLVAAKSLFLALCIALPYLTMQCIMTARENLNPFNTGLVITALRFVVSVWLPMLAISSVATSLGTAVSSVIGVALVWAAALTFLLGHDGPRTDAPFAFAVLGAVFAILFIGILLYQYRQRNTQRARAALLSSVALFLALFVGYVQMELPYVGSLLMHMRYPLNGAPELHLVFNSSAPTQKMDNKQRKPDALLYVTLPTHLEGLDRNNLLTSVNISYTITVSGETYISPWRPAALTTTSISLLVPHSILEQASGSAHLQITLDGTILSPARTQTATMSDHFAVAGNGECDTIGMGVNHFRCGFAFHIPNPIRIEPTAPVNCNRGLLQTAEVRTLDAGTTADPVRIELLNFGADRNVACRVTSLRSTLYRPWKSFSTVLDIPEINLSNYIDR